MNEVANSVMLDESFQAALQRYAQGNGSSAAIAAAAVRAVEALASQSNGTSGGWISVDERLPELGASVALLKADGWENTGSDLEMNIRACGYLADAGPFKHWSIRGERATELKYFTHWMVLPAAPNQGENHVG